MIRILSFGVMGCKSLGLYLVNVCYMLIVIYFRKYIGLVDTKGGVHVHSKTRGKCPFALQKM